MYIVGLLHVKESQTQIFGHIKLIQCLHNMILICVNEFGIEETYFKNFSILHSIIILITYVCNFLTNNLT